METNMSALSVVNLLPSTKEQTQTFAKLIINEIESGIISPLDFKCQIKFIEKTFDLIDKSIKDSVEREADKYGKSFEYKGFKIEKSEAGVSYDYSSDSIYNELKEKLKEREKFLKGLQKPMADPDTGEMCYPPIKKSTTTLKFTAL